MAPPQPKGERIDRLTRLLILAAATALAILALMGGDESRLAETSPDLMVPATVAPATPYNLATTDNLEGAAP